MADVDIRDIFDEASRFIKAIKIDRFNRGAYIDGIETTQAIQYYRAAKHLTSSLGPDNSLHLIARKPTWVRVYVHSGQVSSIANVTGVIKLERRSMGVFWTPFMELSPLAPGTVTALATSNYAVERGSSSNTLNFMIPAEEMVGNLRLTVQVWRQGMAIPEDESVTEVTATLHQTLQLVGVMITYAGTDGAAVNPTTLSIAPPTVNDLQNTAWWTLLTNPISVATYRTTSEGRTWTLPLNDPAPTGGGCSPNWNSLLKDVIRARDLDGNRPGHIYYGLLPTGTPIGITQGTNSGCGELGVGVGMVGDFVAMAHEIGHACGLEHGPCNVTGGDANYPIYTPYDPPGTATAFIGEFGLDMNNGNVKSPALWKDYMSYCGPSWISPYHYGRLVNNAHLNPTAVGLDEPWWKDELTPEEILDIPQPDPPYFSLRRQRKMRLDPVISIIGEKDVDDNIRVHSVLRVNAARAMADARATDLTFELLGDNSEVVASAPIYRLRSRACGCSRLPGDEDNLAEFQFHAYVPDIARGSALRIRRGRDEIWVRNAPEQPVEISSFRAHMVDDTNLEVDWEVGTTTEVDVDLTWSKDEGETWNLLISKLQDGRALVNMTSVSAGKVLVRLLVHDGFSTATSDPVSVEVPRQPPSVVIMHPQEGRTFITGRTLRLWGLVTESSGEPLRDVRAVWWIDGEEVAQAIDAWVTAPDHGEHTCTLILEAEERIERQVSFITVDVTRQEAVTTPAE